MSFIDKNATWRPFLAPVIDNLIQIYSNSELWRVANALQVGVYGAEDFTGSLPPFDGLKWWWFLPFSCNWFSSLSFFCVLSSSLSLGQLFLSAKSYSCKFQSKPMTNFSSIKLNFSSKLSLVIPKWISSSKKKLKEQSLSFSVSFSQMLSERKRKKNVDQRPRNYYFPISAQNASQGGLFVIFQTFALCRSCFWICHRHLKKFWWQK